MSEIRKLAAIMFTDIIGYSALIMSKDERLAMEVPEKNRQIHNEASKYPFRFSTPPA